MVQVNKFQEVRLFRLKKLAKPTLSFFSSIIFIAALVACSATDIQEPAFTNDGEAQYLFELELKEGDTIASLSHEYQAEVIVWEPEDNFAILASAQEADSEFLPQSLGLDKNKKAMQMSVSAQGFTGWASGFSGWASGAGGWATGPGGWASGSGGWAAGERGWMVGHNGWGLGVNTAFLDQNEAAWEQIGLFGAHKASEYLGLGKTVAIIDTGVDLNHPMIRDSLVHPSLWRDYYDNDKTPQDSSTGKGAGHGTAVAGIVLQVAPQVKILPLRVLGSNGVGDMDDVILAVRHAVKSGADIINISIGSFDNSRTLKRILKYAKRNGVYVVAAGGNTGRENSILYPAGFSRDSQLKDSVFSIGSVNADDQISSFSASGNNLFAYAPGENIRTAFPGNRLADVSGTSFATPVMAGSLALVYDKLQYIDRYSRDLPERIESTLEKDRIEKRYGLDSTDSSDWKHAGGITDTNALIHLLSVDNPSFENGSSGWDFYRAGLASILNGTKYELLAEIYAGGYVTKQIYNLQPNTEYEVNFRTAFDTLEQKATVTISNHGRSTVTKSFTKTANARLLKTITVAFKTGNNSTSATFRISNPSYNSNVSIDGFKIRIED